MFLSSASSDFSNGFITSWDIKAGDTITLPVTALNGCVINWGDEFISSHGAGVVGNSHTYQSDGVVDISIIGDISFLLVYNNSLGVKLLELKQWGTYVFGGVAFEDCINMTLENVGDAPILTNTNTLAKLFMGCTTIKEIPFINDWDVAHITSFERTFMDTSLVNQAEINWSTNSLTVLKETFRSSRFAGDIGSWNTSKVTNMERIFANGYGNTHTMENWDTSKCTTFQYCFSWNVAFNGRLTNWNTSMATSNGMKEMFMGAKKFNQPINHLDVSKQTYLSSFLSGALAFNQAVNLWDTSNCISMDSLFTSCAVFNQSLSTFDTSKVLSMRKMLMSTYKFNQSLSTFDTSKVVNMSEMFRKSGFNQSLVTFDTSNVTNMYSMFYDCLNYNRSIGHFDISKVQDLRKIGLGYYSYIASAFKIEAYDPTLIGWASQSVIANRTDVSFYANYTQGLVGSGVATSEGVNKLIDTANAFLTSVSIGDVIHNTTDSSYAFVTAIDSDSILSLSHDIMLTGKEYVIQGSEVAKSRASLVLNSGWTIIDGGGIN